MCRILFSDIDGTCVHYHDPDDDDSRWSIDPFPSTAPDQDSRLARALCGDVRIPTTVLRLPPSTSGSIGIISLRTLQLYAAVRSLGIKVVLISGCRTSTLLQRLPFLPACDAYVCESGGRIFYPNTSIPTALQLSEDYAWRRSHEGVAGPIDIEILQPEKRSNPILWSFYQHLHHNGYTVDARNYSTAFRVKIKSEQEKRGVPALPQGLSKAENLGAIDIYPSTSGKRQAARYLMEKFGTNEKHSMFMCGTLPCVRFFVAILCSYYQCCSLSPPCRR